MLAERIGRAIRKPTVESMLSYTTNELGRGWVYALNTALDETGSLLGPMAVALVVARSQGYRTAYGLLLAPAALAIACLTAARIVFPLPSRLEKGRTASARGFDRSYWLSMVAASFFAAGLMSFELISFHLATAAAASRAWVPLLLAIATAGGIVASLLMGRLFDRIGAPVVYGAVVVSAGFSPLVFFGSSATVVAGMVLWGVGYATQDTLFKAIIASRIPEGRRNTAFGLFYAGYGVGWLAGSIVAGVLYERSRAGLVAFSVGVMLASLPVFAVALGEQRAR
jgi:MFS family permease